MYNLQVSNNSSIIASQNSNTNNGIEQSLSNVNNQNVNLTSSISNSSTGTKNISIILPGDKKPKMIGSGKKPDIKADVVLIKN